MHKQTVSTKTKLKHFEPGKTFNCFGCSQSNHSGLKLKFEVSEENNVFSSVQLCSAYESFPGIVHGGMVATVLDEVMAQTTYLTRGKPSMTIGLKIRYLQPMYIDTSYLVSGKITSSADLKVTEVEGRVMNTLTNETAAIAHGTFISLSPDQMPSNSRLPSATLSALSMLS